MKIKRKQAKDRRPASRSSTSVDEKQPFIEHAHELRRRLYFVVISIVLSGAAVYFVQQHVVNLLLRPAHGQSFIYTSPGGGLDFLFRVCVYTGLIISTPVIVYNLLGFLAPMLSASSSRFIFKISIITTLLAIAGVIFGYYIGLPAALHFLLHQFTTVQIKPLVTIQSYLNFVMAYLLGSALLFQLPIALICINKIKPLKPSGLFRYERWVILAAFILAGLMNPTPNLLSQLLVAGPFILMYQVGILIIAIANRPKRSNRVNDLLQKDIEIQKQRLEAAQQALKVKAEDIMESVKPEHQTSTPTTTNTNQAQTRLKPRTVDGSFVDLRRSSAQQPLVPRNLARKSYIDMVSG